MTDDVSFFSALVRRFRDMGKSGNEAGSMREALAYLIEETDDGERADPVSDEERELLHNAVGFGELRVEDVMVPRADICSIDVEASLDDVLAEMKRAKHSRLVVRREELDDVVGFVHIKDVIGFWGEESAFRLADLVRPVPFVPHAMRALDLLAEMRVGRVHLAVVVDEYGGTDGIVTFDDMVEELVGEIADEHDEDEGPPIVEVGDGSFEVDGRVELEEMEALIGRRLLDEEEAEEVDTMGGLAFALADRVPKRGETIEHPEAGLRLTVLDADPRRVRRLKVIPIAPRQVEKSSDEDD